jgi:HK97 family phage major capsid protein
MEIANFMNELATARTFLEVGKPKFDIGLSQREAAQFSFAKLLRAAVDPPFHQKHGGFEMRVAQEAAKDSLTCALAIPAEVMRLGLRDVTTSTSSGTSKGGSLVATDKPSEHWGAYLQQATRIRALGATVLESKGNITLPRVDTGTTVQWPNEGVAADEASPTFSSVSLNARTVTGWFDVSRRLLLQVGPEGEAFLAREVANAIGAAIDADAISIIRGTSGVNAVSLGTNGSAPTYASLVDMEALVGLDNAEGDGTTLGFLTNSKVRRVLRKTEEATGAGVIWKGRESPLEQGRVLGLPAMVSEAVPSNLTKGSGSNLSSILYANWSEVFHAQFGPIGVVIDRVTQATGATVRVTLLQECDTVVRRPEAVAVISDAVAA